MKSFMQIAFWFFVGLIAFFTWHIFAYADPHMSKAAMLGTWFAWVVIVFPLALLALIFKPRF